MKKLDGFITDQTINNKDYSVFITPADIGFLYSSDIRGGKEVKTYVNNLPSFEEIYDCFLSCKNTILKKNRLQDICLSLFFHPYFTEFYVRIKRDADFLPHNKKIILNKYLLDDLSNVYHYKGIMEYDVGGLKLKQWYIENDIFNKSNELKSLLKQ